MKRLTIALLLLSFTALVVWGCSQYTPTAPSANSNQLTDIHVAKNSPLYAQSAVSIEVPGDFGTIQEAVDAASPGDVIKVNPGEYTEDVTVTKSDVRIIAQGSVTLVGGFFIQHVSGVHINGFTIRGGLYGGGGAAIHVPLSTGVHISGNTVSDVDQGIVIGAASRECLVRNNKVHSRSPAFLFIINANQNKVIGNSGTSDNSHGLVVSASSNFNFFKDNDFSNNGRSGVELLAGSSENRFFGNTFNNNDSHGISLLDRCSKNQFDRNEMRNNGVWGVEVKANSESDGNRFQFNEITGNGLCDIWNGSPTTILHMNTADCVGP